MSEEDPSEPSTAPAGALAAPGTLEAEAPGGSLTLLIVFAGLAIVTSFVCSLSEASILSVPKTHATVLVRQGRLTGRLLERMKDQIERPLNAILTLNTLANTVGSIGVGTQAALLFDSVWVGVASGVMTYLVLVFGELIPKKLGAVYARSLAPPISVVVVAMEVITLPLIVLARPVTWVADRLVSRFGAEAPATMDRGTLEVIADMGEAEGAIGESESEVIRNMLRLNERRVQEVMTPRTRVFMLPQTATIAEAMGHERFTQHTRIPVFADGPDDVTGVVIKGNLYEAFAAGEPGRRMTEFRRPVTAVPEQATLLRVLEEFGRLGHHIFLVVDEFGGTAGVITLEDVLEAIIGREIIDESDRGVATPDGRIPGRNSAS
ncbi:MAG: hemolysin family protein [Planctomycetota bacterium]